TPTLFATMEKLPLYSSDARRGSLKPKVARPRPRWLEKTIYRRLPAVLCLVAVWYLFGRPVSLYLTNSFAPCNTPECLKTSSPEPAYIAEPTPAVHKENPPAPVDQKLVHPKPVSKTKIPLEAHIMSKCPDAQECLQDLVLPAMERISDKVDFQLSFIARVSKETSEIECKHGPTECIGNMLMLCAANLPFPPTADASLLPKSYPRTPIIRSLGFANCLENDFPRIPERDYVHQCALEHGIDFEALNQCASQENDNPSDGPHGAPPLSGLALLRKNALRGERLGVKISCTVRLAESVWCIRDNGEWKDCAQDGKGGNPQVLIDEVERLWEEKDAGFL
ncbi:Gamma interferon inducible lysosomal thiol reductase GILT, partial [Penicillium hispanicum]|uniref:Gamma interferon inducible lysosomal thiol reductase GILT n=1 Tax=Penicillium hispanicum TaxID=1080232 RepID=UPI002540BACE